VTTEHLITEIMEREGWRGSPVYTNHPHDRGGPTNTGITLATLSAWRRRPVTAADVRDLEEEEIRAIYRERYIHGPRFDEIPDALLRHQVVDCGVLHGKSRAAKWLQVIIGAKADGQIGTFTLGALAQCEPHQVGLRLAARRQQFLGEIVTANYKARRAGKTSQDQAANAEGWANRASAFLLMEAEAGPRPWETGALHV
jgi:lysozyme family protein